MFQIEFRRSKIMRNLNKFLSSVLFLVMLWSIFSISPAYATTITKTEFLFYGDYEFDEESSSVSSLTLTEKAKLKFVFDDNTYMPYYGRMEIADSNNKVVYDTTLRTVFNEFTVTTNALNKGRYTITIYGDCADEFHFKLFKVYDDKLPKVKKIKLNKKSFTLSSFKEKRLKATITPQNAGGTTKWKSSNTNVAIVDSYGKMVTDYMGKTTITVSCGGKKAKCTVYVNKDFTEIGTGKSTTIKRFAKYISGYKKTKWKSNNPAVVSVSKNSIISAKKHGVAKIAAKINGKTYTITVYSYDKEVIKQKTINAIKKALYVPSSFKLDTVKYPSDNKCVVYYSAKTRLGDRVYNAKTGYLYKNKFYYYDTFDD